MNSGHEEIAALNCPKCGSALEKGYIAGHWVRLRWTLQARTKTIFAGEPLRARRAWWNAPTLEAARCKRCKLGLFTYDG